MSAAEPAVLSRPRAATPGGSRDRRAQRRWPWWLGAGASCSPSALGLRLWGVKQGLPYAYNADENAHFVPKAIGLFGHGWNPHYFVNPPAYTYLLHVVFARLVRRPRGRLARLRDAPDRGLRRRARHRRGPRHARRRGCCTWRARALRPRASACSPRRCWRSPSCRSSTRTSRSTTCRRWRRSRSRCGARRASCATGALRDYALAGVGLGLACATKYTGGIVLLPLLAAGASSWRPRAGRYAAARGLVLAGRRRPGRLRRRQPLRGARLRGLPRRPAAPGRRRRRRAGQARADPEHRAPLLPVDVHLGAGLGAARGRASAALGAARARRPPRSLLVLGPAPSSSCSSWAPRRASSGAGCCRSSRSLCLLAAYAIVRARRSSPAGARPRWRPALAVLGAVLLLRPGPRLLAAQRAWSLSRADTRNLARAWLVDHVPAEHEDRRRAGRARRVGQDIGHPNAGDRQRRALVEVPDQPLEHRQRRLVDPGAGADREHRGLRAHALPRADRPLRAQGLLLGRERLDAARARRGPARASCRGRSPTTASSSAAPTLVFEASPVPPRRRAGDVQLRLVLRLLPAGLRAPGAR